MYLIPRQKAVCKAHDHLLLKRLLKTLYIVTGKFVGHLFSFPRKIHEWECR